MERDSSSLPKSLKIMKKNLQPTVSNVSKKFYTDIRKRISSTSRAVGLTAAVEASCIEAVDAYINSGIAPAGDTATEILLIFNLLRSEIDRAISRSAAARQRAARRKTSASSEAPESPAKTSVDETEPTSDTTREPLPLTRRERRLLQRLSNKIMRDVALQKHQAS